MSSLPTLDTANSRAWLVIAREVLSGFHDDDATDSFHLSLIIGLRSGSDAESKRATERLLELRKKR